MIVRASAADLADVAELAGMLWPGHAPGELEKELAGLLARPDAALFLLRTEERAAQGFAQCQMRRDYVEGASSSPVGYLEGIFVRPEARGTGGAGALLAACEAWAGAQGCREFASDCAWDNEASIRFHRSAGFAEANRIVCFIKPLHPAGTE